MYSIKLWTIIKIFKKLIYRADRGTKEMDILLSSFVNKHIDSDENLLNELNDFLNYEDEILLKFLSEEHN